MKSNILYGPYGTRLKEESQRQSFSLSGPTDVIHNTPVRESISMISQEYLNSGARWATIPCFGTRNLLHDDDGKRSYSSVLKESFNLLVSNLEKAKQEVKNEISLVFCVGPVHDCYKPELSPKAKAAAEFHEQQIAIIQEVTKHCRAPLTILFETIPSGQEAEGIARALKKRRKKHHQLKGIISYPFTATGEPLGNESFPDIFRRVLKHNSPALLGQSLNCGPIEGAALALEQLSRDGLQPLGVYPNASSKPHAELDTAEDSHGLINPKATAQFLRYLAFQYQLKFIGGCCGYTHQDIAELLDSETTSSALPPTDLPEVQYADREILDSGLVLPISA